jgi:hypothetical protein
MRWCTLLFLFNITFSNAQPGALTEHFKIDQFGYPTYAQKICVINDPVTGFDASQAYTPGTTLHIRNANTNALVFSGPSSSWHSGATYDQSGDKLWWFDFSTLTAAGSYYVYDPTNNKHSFYFDIRDDVYDEVLKQSVRMFFYQRSGFAKTEQYAYQWNDGASHLGSLQDLDCRLATSPNDASTSKQLQGGWFDAGDYNKYVNFAYEPVHDLLMAYIERPLVWTDDYNIPESGNGIPDLLDEVKWEMDWLRRMQLSNGSVLMKVSVADWSAASPPSADSSPRRYGPAQASATRTACSMFAIGAIAFNMTGIPEMQAYADTLETAAVNAWNWLIANPAYSYYNNAGFTSANPEMNEYQQYSAQVGAAVLLYALTNQADYKTYVENNYDDMHPMQWWFWYPWESIIQDLLIFYTTQPGISTSVKDDIRGRFTSSMTNSSHLLPAYNNTTCGYRAYMNNGDNVCGSNRPRGHTGSIFWNYIHYDLNTDTIPYRNAALGYINFLHGVNPISTVMLTNMYDYGAEKSANEMYHSWFGDGTPYDNALNSTYGPAPGYQPGGFNPNYAPDPAYGGTIIPPQSQPSLKSYKDWNTSWPENSWEITETSISNQGSYVKLLSKFVTAPCVKTVTSYIDHGQSTLRRAAFCSATGDTIKIDLPQGDTIHITSNQIVLDKNLTILNLNSGKAPLYFDYSGTGMKVNPGTTIHLYDLTLSGDGSSLIQNLGILHLHNVTMDATGLSSQPLVNQNQAQVYGLVELKQ